MAATHEAGHFLAFEVLGLGASVAQIHGRLFGWGGWGGTAHPLSEVHFLYATPDDLLKEALVSLAGPLAEQILSNGDALSSAGELFGARIYVDRAAKMTGEDTDILWHRTIIKAVALVYHYNSAINGIAQLLSARRRVWPGNRAIIKIFASISCMTDLNYEIPQHLQFLAEQIYGAIPNLLGEVQS